MDRKAARALVKSTVEATDGYAAVYSGPPDSFDGQSPVAVVTSKSIRATFDARDEYTLESGILLSIYVRRDSGQEDDAEDALDDLVRAAAVALLATGAFTIEASDAAAEGAPIRIVDGTKYRVERITLRSQEDYEG